MKLWWRHKDVIATFQFKVILAYNFQKRLKVTIVTLWRHFYIYSTIIKIIEVFKSVWLTEIFRQFCDCKRRKILNEFHLAFFMTTQQINYVIDDVTLILGISQRNIIIFTKHNIYTVLKLTEDKVSGMKTPELCIWNLTTNRYFFYILFLWFIYWFRLKIHKIDAFVNTFNPYPCYTGWCK